MRIGYPCINRSIGCTGGSTFRLRSYTPERLLATAAANLDCLARMLEYNAEHGMLFFRVTSDLVPFASHPVCDADWQGALGERFRKVGSFARQNGMRISMHPDQFTLINSPDAGIFERSARELLYHAQVLDLMGLDETARIQVHVGGVYGDKPGSIHRFADRLPLLHPSVKSRLTVENDERLYSLGDCLSIHGETGLPVLFDVFHHRLNNAGEPVAEAIHFAAATWKDGAGIPMVDYSSQKPDERRGAHAATIDPDDFSLFLRETGGTDFDVMLEIKDKERSALAAVELARGDPRFSGFPGRHG